MRFDDLKPGDLISIGCVGPRLDNIHYEQPVVLISIKKDFFGGKFNLEYITRSLKYKAVTINESYETIDVLVRSGDIV